MLLCNLRSCGYRYLNAVISVYHKLLTALWAIDMLMMLLLVDIHLDNNCKLSRNAFHLAVFWVQHHWKWCEVLHLMQSLWEYLECSVGKWLLRLLQEGLMTRIVNCQEFIPNILFNLSLSCFSAQACKMSSPSTFQETATGCPYLSDRRFETRSAASAPEPAGKGTSIYWEGWSLPLNAKPRAGPLGRVNFWEAVQALIC